MEIAGPALELAYLMCMFLQWVWEGVSPRALGKQGTEQGSAKQGKDGDAMPWDEIAIYHP